MTKKRLPPLLLAVLLAPAFSAVAEEPDDGSLRSGLDDSITRVIRTEPRYPPYGEAAPQLPDLGGPVAMPNTLPQGGRWQGNLPYGAGYEARQGRTQGNLHGERQGSGGSHGHGGRRGR